MTILDEEIANRIGVIESGKKRKLISAGGERVKGLIAYVPKFKIEEEELEYQMVLVFVKFLKELEKV